MKQFEDVVAVSEFDERGHRWMAERGIGVVRHTPQLIARNRTAHERMDHFDGDLCKRFRCKRPDHLS